MSKTINQALKDLYLSLGGDPSALTDNSTVSDYIADLENGLKGLAELPAPSSTNSGKIAKVVSDGEGGYIWGAENETSELPAPESTDINKLVGVVSDGASGAEYGLVSAPSSSEFLEIPLVKNGSTWNIDSSVTLSMLEEAYNAGKMFLLSFAENAIGVMETKRIIADVSYTDGVGFNMTGAFVSMTRSGNTITHVYSNEFIITAMSFATSVALFTVELAVNT